jgi:hypothetical protein
MDYAKGVNVMGYLEITPKMVREVLFEKTVYVVIFKEFTAFHYEYDEGFYNLSEWKLADVNVLLKCGGERVKYFIEESK